MTKTKAKSKAAKSRRRPANHDGLTRLQRRGLEALNDVEFGERGTKRKRKRSLASRAHRKISRRHKVLRPAVYVLVGTAEVTAKVIKHAGIRAGRASRWGGRKIAAKVKADIHYRKWTPESAAVRKGRWLRPITDVTCCGQHFGSAQTLNTHLVEKHRGETRQVADRPQIQRGHTRRTAGKVIVRPHVAGGGRHRARHNIPDAKRVGDLIAAYATQIANLRKQVDGMGDASGIKSKLRSVGVAIGDIDKPTTLAELRSQLVSLEVGLNRIAEGIREYGAMLKHDGTHGANIEPALVNPFILLASEQVEEAGRAFTRFVASFENVYSLHIRLAQGAKQGEAQTPNINLGVG